MGKSTEAGKKICAKIKGDDRMEEKIMPHVKGYLRDFMLTVPKEIYACSGIGILGRRIKSLLFSTDASIIQIGRAHA